MYTSWKDIKEDWKSFLPSPSSVDLKPGHCAATAEVFTAGFISVDDQVRGGESATPAGTVPHVATFGGEGRGRDVKREHPLTIFARHTQLNRDPHNQEPDRFHLKFHFQTAM